MSCLVARQVIVLEGGSLAQQMIRKAMTISPGFPISNTGEQVPRRWLLSPLPKGPSRPLPRSTTGNIQLINVLYIALPLAIVALKPRGCLQRCPELHIHQALLIRSGAGMARRAARSATQPKLLADNVTAKATSLLQSGAPRRIFLSPRVGRPCYTNR